MIELVHEKTEGRLSTSFFAFVSEGQRIGISQLRHRPSHARDIPAEAASHVYYEVFEPYRGRGLGREILGLTLQEAYRLGMRDLIVTCMEDNPASRAIIERNGGIFQGQYDTELQAKILKYSIKINGE